MTTNRPNQHFRSYCQEGIDKCRLGNEPNGTDVKIQQQQQRSHPWYVIIIPFVFHMYPNYPSVHQNLCKTATHK